MSKKTFKDNPAMQFISTPVEEAAEHEASPVEEKHNPPEGYRYNPLYIEKKTRRVQLVFQPSLYEKAKKKADAQGISFNEYVHKLLERDLNGQEEN